MRETIDYTRWKAELKALAKKRELEWLIANDEEWMLQSYGDDFSPAEALEELISEAQRN